MVGLRNTIVCRDHDSKLVLPDDYLDSVEKELNPSTPRKNQTTSEFPIPDDEFDLSTLGGKPQSGSPPDLQPNSTTSTNFPSEEEPFGTASPGGRGYTGPPGYPGQPGPQGDPGRDGLPGEIILNTSKAETNSQF